MYLKDIVAVGHILSDTLFIILKFLLANCFRYELLCENLHPLSFHSIITCFIALSPDLLCGALFTYTCNSKGKTPCLGKGPYQHVHFFHSCYHFS